MKRAGGVAAFFLLLYSNLVNAGLTISDGGKRSAAVLVSHGNGQDRATQQLATVLTEHYGMNGDRISYLSGSEATGQDIEAGIFRAVRGLRAHDVLLVVVTLKLDQVDSGQESILVTTRYDPAKPWTGLPTIALRNIASKSSSGTLIVVYPDCASDKTGLAYLGASLRSQTDDASSQALIAYCPTEGVQADQFLLTLADVLKDSARSPNTRAPWQSEKERGLVSVAALVNQLREAAPRFHISSQVSSGGGWLRVFEPGSVVPVNSSNRELQRVRAMEAAMARINSDDPTVVVDAIQTLGDAKAPAAPGEFTRLLTSSQSLEVRAAAARALGLFAGDASLTALAGAATDPDVTVRVEALSAIARLGDLPAVVPTLRPGLTDMDARVRAAAAYGLGQQWSYMDAADADRIATEVASLVRSDPDENVRGAAVWSLAKGKRLEGLEDVKNLAISGAPAKVRVAALDSLGELASAGTEPVLVVVAREQAPTNPDGMRIRLAAIRSLGKLNTAAADDALLYLTKDADSTVAAAANSALADSRSLSESALSLAADRSESVERRTLAIRILGRNSDPGAGKVLLALLSDPNMAIKAEATSSLGGRTDNATIERLGTLLLDRRESVEIRALAADALGKNATSAALVYLAVAAADEQEEVRAVVATAIARGSSAPKHLATLIRLADDSSPLVRAAAVKSLGKFSAASTVRKLLEKIARDDQQAPGVREVAVQVLRAAQVDESAATTTRPAQVVDLGPFQKGQKRWHIDVFWCEGPGAEGLKRQAEAYVADVEKFAHATRTESEVIGRIELRSISERYNAFPNYQSTQNEIRYESGNESEHKWSERMKIGTGESFVSRPVSKSTPGYLSVFLCSAQSNVE